MSGGNGDGQQQKQEPDELTLRYQRALHRMQTAVAWQLVHKEGINIDSRVGRRLKHLRVGVNSAMADQGALAKLLVEKGVISDEELRLAITEAAEREADLAVRLADAPPGVTFG